MPQSEQTSWANLKQQFARYKKQSAMLVSLAAVLLVVVTVQLSDPSPQQSQAADTQAAGLITTPTSTTTQGNLGAETVPEKPILASWADIHTTLLRPELFKGPWQEVQPQHDGDVDGDGDGIPDDRDNCPNWPNPEQADADGDGTGDACDQQDRSTSIHDIPLLLRGTTLQRGDRLPTAYINRHYYELGSTFWIEGHKLKLISVQGGKAVVADEHGHTRTLSRNVD